MESRGVVEDVKERVGQDNRNGVYVTARREVGRLGQPACMVERRTHLYRPPLESIAPVGTQSAGKGSRTDADFEIRLATTPAMLFRFSALTFNTHRIHWDLRYCTDVEQREGRSRLPCLVAALDQVVHRRLDRPRSAHLPSPPFCAPTQPPHSNYYDQTLQLPCHLAARRRDRRPLLWTMERREL